jgi:hypothetical protein
MILLWTQYTVTAVQRFKGAQSASWENTVQVLSTLNNYLYSNNRCYFSRTGEFKLRKFRLQIQQRPSTLGAVAQYNYRQFFDSDHYSFWNNDPSIDALYLTDTADFRGYMKYCYHNECDNLSHATPTRLQFLTNTADSVAMTALEMTGLEECIPKILGSKLFKSPFHGRVSHFEK